MWMQHLSRPLIALIFFSAIGNDRYFSQALIPSDGTPHQTLTSNSNVIETSAQASFDMGLDKIPNLSKCEQARLLGDLGPSEDCYKHALAIPDALILSPVLIAKGLNGLGNV